MKPISKTILVNFFETRTDIFGEHSTFEKFTIEDGSWDGINSNAIFGRIVFTDEAGKRCNSSPLVIKSMPQMKISEFFLPFAFFNEIFFYATVLPIFSKFGAAEELFPKFYHSCLTFGAESEAAIIFENISSMYKPAAVKAHLDYAHLSLMVRKLGQFHAYSYQLKSKMPQRYRSLVNVFTDTHFSVTGELSGFMETVAQRGVEPLVGDPVYGDRVEKIREMIKSSVKYVKNVFTGEKDDPISILCHGDYLRNNVMFRYENQLPVDMKIVDLAACRQTSPAVDLALVLYINSDQNTRDEYFDQLVDEYYTALKKTFPRNKAIPNKHQIQAELKSKSFYAYLVASYFQPHLIAEDKQMPSFYDFLPENFDGEFTVDLHSSIGMLVGDSVATQSLSDILKDMIDRGFI